MLSLSTTFNRASGSHRDFAFWLLLWWLFIDNDRQDRERERRRKRLASKRCQVGRTRTEEPAARFRRPKSPAPRPF